MDQHSIPQDVTGFQFKLIGNMTVKQFGFVAVGVVSAAILYYLPLHFVLAFLVKALLIPLLGASGAIIAFLPIDGRPIDVMASNFMKAFLAPNQYVYHKAGYTFSFSNIASTKAQQAQETQKSTLSPKQRQINKKELQLQTFLQSTQKQIKNPLDEKEFAFLKSISTPVIASPLPTAAVPLPPMPSPNPLPSAPTTPRPIIATMTSLPQQTAPPVVKETPSEQHVQPGTHEQALLMEKQLQQVHAEKQRLEQELANLRQQLPAQPAPAQIAQQPAPLPAQTKAAQPAVNTMAPHIPDTANVLVGLVKDSRGNVLPHILVEVKDKDANPVRAFKTNALGQFASATPLANGIYTIELEDPKRQNTFDAIQIIADNKIILPLEIISHDAREQLRRELFN